MEDRRENGADRWRLEVVASSVADALAIERLGADRIELCAAIELGGLTPSPGLVQTVVESVSLPVCAMARPRPGGFVHDAPDARALCLDVEFLAGSGASGIVCGALTSSGVVDTALVRACVDAAGPIPVTFHRAFDLCDDLERALETLIELGVARVLTGGGRARALDAIERLAALVKQASGRIEMIVAGGVRAQNAAEIARATGVSWLHAGPRRLRISSGARTELNYDNATELDPDAVAALLPAR